MFTVVLLEEEQSGQRLESSPVVFHSSCIKCPDVRLQVTGAAQEQPLELLTIELREQRTQRKQITENTENREQRRVEFLNVWVCGLKKIQTDKRFDL